MGWFSRIKKVKMDDGQEMSLSEHNLKLHYNQLKKMASWRSQAEAQRDEALRKAELLEARLATANLKLKEFGNPGLF